MSMSGCDWAGQLATRPRRLRAGAKLRVQAMLSACGYTGSRRLERRDERAVRVLSASVSFWALRFCLFPFSSTRRATVPRARSEVLAELRSPPHCTHHTLGHAAFSFFATRVWSPVAPAWRASRRSNQKSRILTHALSARLDPYSIWPPARDGREMLVDGAVASVPQGRP